MSSATKFQLADVFEPLFQPARYKVFYGGRGGAKSWAFARALLLMGLQRPIRVLCCREFQSSIADSVHKLLCDQIADLGFASRYIITQKNIVGVNGSEFIFKGLRHNVTEIKSLEGVDIAWTEEAQSVTKESWDLLIPTIRKEGSEIWISFNPGRPDDETYQRFVVAPPEDAVVVKVGWQDNPWFPDTLRKEMEYCRRISPDDYRHIWEGEPSVLTDAQVFKNRYIIDDFETPANARFFHGCDWGFACLKGDTMVTTDHGDVPIKEIKIGDRVLTRDGFKKVIHTQNRGNKAVYDVDFGYKRHIIATGDHRIFTYDGWKKVEELQENEQICVIESNSMERFIKPVRMSAPIKLSLLPEKEEVFDITVENGEYFANGILVHNCDPTALIRCFIQGERLYIDQEAYGVGVELDETPQLFDSIPTARSWPIKADCARPETISFMRRRGFNITPAKKWSGSVEDGIAVLKSFEKIVIHPRCKHTIEEFNMYSYKVDKNNGDILPVILDAWNHCVDSLRYALDGYIKGKGLGLNISKGVKNRIASEKIRGLF